MQEATTHKAIHEALRTIYGEEIARAVMAQVIGKYGWSFIPGGGVLEKMAEAIKLELAKGE